MENNTIKCPFCFKESQRGSRCTGCLATVLYGTIRLVCCCCFVVDFWFIDVDRYVNRYGRSYYQSTNNCGCWVYSW